jgi:membrane-bound serine protease (ClpP class)
MASASGSDSQDRQRVTTTSASSLSGLEALLAQRKIEEDRIVTLEGWFALPQVKRPPMPAKIEKAFVIPIHGPITGTTFKSIERKVLRCLASGAQIVIFDIDTPGGEGQAMLSIVALINNNLKNIRTVAFVNSEAISAGAIISLACSEIAMTPRGKLGDSMPVMVGPEGYVPIPPAERGKIESYIRAQIRDLAEAGGYSVPLCEAMVSLPLEVWLVRNRQTRELRYVDKENLPGPVLNIPAASQPTTWPAEQQPWEFLRVADGPNTLVTMTARQAVEFNFTRIIADDLDQLAGHYNVIRAATVLEDNWSETLVGLMTSPVLVGFLVFVAIMALYTESHLPHGLGLIIAVCCFVIIFGSRYLIGMAEWWQIAVLLLGLVLLGIEIFVTPGMLVLGVIGLVCILVGMLGMLAPASPGKILPDTPLQWSSFTDSIFALLVAFLAATACLPLLGKYLHRLPVAGKLVLPPVQVGSAPQLPAESPLRRIQPGDVGVVESRCRPAGKVRFGDQLLDVESEGGIIEAGSQVRVLRLEGATVFVEQI